MGAAGLRHRNASPIFVATARNAPTLIGSNGVSRESVGGIAITMSRPGIDGSCSHNATTWIEGTDSIATS